MSGQKIEFDPERDLKGVGIGAGGELICRNSIHQNEHRWCEHLQRTVQAGADADLLHADQHIIVPIFPTADIFVEVWIGIDIGNGSGIMSMNYTPDIGRPYSVSLGFWNPGEGMGVIRGVILDFLRSKLDPAETFDAFTPIKTRCPSSIHGMKASRIMAEKSSDMRWKWQCLWNIVMEKACTPCIEESSGTSGDNFGIDDSVVAANKKPWQS